MTSGFMAVVFFGMPIWLGLSLGFILAAVSPAVVVTSMIDLQHKGYGALKGIPSLIIAAASFDDIVAIGGFSICIGMAVQREDSSLIYSALHGPLSVVYGILIGTIAGAILSV
jgi:NhaP-type Na+/H+ or K+/H+ antiporter